MTLYGRKLGVFDPKKEIYRAMDPATGKLSEPVTPPWQQQTVASRPVPAQRAPVIKEEETPSEQPPWFPYVIGGGVMGIVLMFGMASQMRR